jgi:Na+/H+ antiporter NhaA
MITDGQNMIKLYGSLGVSGIVLLAALFVMLNQKYGEREKRWAVGAITFITFILGYWVHIWASAEAFPLLPGRRRLN